MDFGDAKCNMRNDKILLIIIKKKKKTPDNITLL